MSYTRGTVAWMPHSIDNLTGGWMVWQNAPSTDTAWGVQYRAVYIPLRVPARCVVRSLGFANGATGAGNFDIGLYDAAGTRLVSSGSTAKGTVQNIKVADVTDTTIGPGLYYLALALDSTTDTVFAMADTAPIPAARGLLTETLGSVTLPATATWTVDQAFNFIPVVTALLVTEVS